MREGAGVARAELEPSPAAFVRLAEAGVERVDLVFRPGAAVEAAFDLPEGPLAELRAMIENEIGYQSPFEAGLALSFEEAEALPRGWRVRAAICLRERVDPVLAGLSTAGIGVGAVRFRPDGGRAEWSAAPAWTVGGAESRRRLLALAGPPAVAACAFLVLMTLVVADLGLRSAAVADDVAAARAQIARASRQALLAEAAEAEARQSALRLGLPALLARTLPNDTWLEQLSVTWDGIEVSGFSPSAAETARLLGTLPVLREVRFAAPVVRDNRQNLERFRLAAAFAGQDG